MQDLRPGNNFNIMDVVGILAAKYSCMICLHRHVPNNNLGNLLTIRNHCFIPEYRINQFVKLDIGTGVIQKVMELAAQSQTYVYDITDRSKKSKRINLQVQIGGKPDTPKRLPPKRFAPYVRFDSNNTRAPTPLHPDHATSPPFMFAPNSPSYNPIRVTSPTSPTYDRNT